MAKLNRKKLGLHGSVAVAVTVLVMAAVILLNAIFGALADRYGWYVDMNPTLEYPATDAFYTYVDTYVMSELEGTENTVRILFCEEEESLLASDETMLVLSAAKELSERYPERVRIEYLDIVAEPRQAREYGVDASTDVVVVCGDRSKVCSLEEFYMFEGSNVSTPVAYRGHRRFATVLRTVVSRELPVCYVTTNHGETFPDNEMMYAVADAGYDARRLDSLSDGIPADCALLLTYNPDRDFTDEDGVAGKSEIAALRAYMENGGRYMVFVSADTFSFGGFPHLEGFLSEWGVAFEHKKGTEGREDCYLVRDPGHALSTDGYTVLARADDSESAKTVLAPALEGGDLTVMLGNATVIRPAEGFGDNGRGQTTKGDVTVTPLLSSFAGAEAWVSGRAVDRAGDDGYTFMTLSERDAGEKSGYLLACSSIEFACEDSMQSAVFDNKTVFMSVVQAMGKDDVPLHIQPQPISDSTIRTMTTAQAKTVTWVAVAVPAVAMLAAGLIVLSRRKYS